MKAPKQKCQVQAVEYLRKEISFLQSMLHEDIAREVIRNELELMQTAVDSIRVSCARCEYFNPGEPDELMSGYSSCKLFEFHASCARCTFFDIEHKSCTLAWDEMFLCPMGHEGSRGGAHD